MKLKEGYNIKTKLHYLPFLLFLFLGVSWSVDAANVVYLEEVYEDAVALVIDSNEVVLEVGERKHDVKLIDIFNRGALLEINGLRKRIGISTQIKVGSSYQSSSSKRVLIPAQRGGHHYIMGKINGGQIEFVVDTGASIIAINQSDAKRLGINYLRGQRGQANTANGQIEIRRVVFDRVNIGGIVQYDIAAAIFPDSALSVALLGNSYLSLINLEIADGVMILESK